MIRRAEVRSPVTVAAHEIRVGDEIHIGGRARRVATMRQVYNGRQLRLDTGELLAVVARTEYVVYRRQEVRR